MNTVQKLSAERAKRVFDQQLQIVRQKELVAKLEQRDNSAAMLGRARTVLAGMELSLGELIAAYERARENEAAKLRLAIAPSNRPGRREAAREHVARDVRGG